MNLTKDVRLALALLTFINKHKEVKRYSLEVIAPEIKADLPFLCQIARKLRKAGIIQAHKGPGGGYSFIKIPTILEVIKAVKTSKRSVDAYYTEYDSATFHIEQLINFQLNSKWISEYVHI